MSSLLDKDSLNEAFPSNSRYSKPERIAEERKVKPVADCGVTQRKKGFGAKIAGLFLEDSTKSVGNWAFHDILIPAGKALICDIVGWGGFAEMLLFGDKRGGRGSRRDRDRGYTSYGSYYVSDRDRDRDRDRGRDRDKDRDRGLSRMARSRHEFSELIFDTRGKAEEVLVNLTDLTIDYERASVADLYQLVGLESDPPDTKYGWTDLRDANVTRARGGGYIINLPRTEPLD